MSSPESNSTSSVRATKRKLDDAFQSLDAAVAPKERAEQPPPQKKPFISRSLYSTLAKYGIRSKNPDAPKNSSESSILQKTPHLNAILNRAATRTRKALPFRESSSPAIPLSPLADYRPSSIPSFLARLATFKLATYANKPPTIDAVAAAKCGWINDGKDRLLCGICSASWVVVGKDRMTRDAANALIEKQRVSLVEAHKKGCPWRSRQCDADIYRIPLQSPSTTVRELKTNGLALDTVLQGIEIKHPLTSTQLNSLLSTMSSFQLPGDDLVPSSEGTPSSEPSSSEPSTTAVLTSLFGWSLAPERPRTASLSRATSLAQTPSLSRASSVTPSASRPLLRTAASIALTRDTSLLHCVLCQRRVGLWAFAPPKDTTQLATLPTETSIHTQDTAKQRQFDLLKEHRSYCPYVIRSTVVPSLPTSPSIVSMHTPRQFSDSHVRSSSSTSQLNGSSALNGNGGALEGWRAILTVVLRYGMAQRHQLSRMQRVAGIGLGQVITEDEMQVDTDGVEAMVEGVKSRGGKELLKYVKGLLG